MFNKSAYVSVVVRHVSGRGRLRLSHTHDTEPYAYWSFAFLEFPKLELDVSSRFEGRNFSQISTVIENQVL